MSKNTKNSLIMSVLMLIIVAIYTVCVKVVDVAPIGPENSSVGFASLNGPISLALPYNAALYKVSEVLGIFALLFVAVFMLIALKQVIVRKGIFKADQHWYVLGVFYVLVGIVYLLFEKVVINYRPIILDEGLEASYPSSHTVLALCVFITAAMQLKALDKTKRKRNLQSIACIVCAVIMIVSRFLSGVHWFTDIVGGLIISAFLIMTYVTMLSFLNDAIVKKQKSSN